MEHLKHPWPADSYVYVEGKGIGRLNHIGGSTAPTGFYKSDTHYLVHFLDSRQNEHIERERCSLLEVGK